MWLLYTCNNSGQSSHQDITNIQQKQNVEGTVIVINVWIFGKKLQELENYKKREKAGVQRQPEYWE